MPISREEALELAREVIDTELVSPVDIPRIALYMEQVTSFFDEAMAGMRRNDSEKLMTKTMINNYTKEGILPRPNRKKYNREHMYRLVYIFVLKQILAMQDIKQLLEMANTQSEVEPLYQAFLEINAAHARQYAQHLEQLMDEVEGQLQEKGLNGQENFDQLLMMCMVSDASIQKRLVEKMLDTRTANTAAAGEKAEKK